VLNKDYKEILQTLLGNRVRFLDVGAYAMAAYGYPRATGDLDIWVEASSDNALRTYNALAKFGAPLDKLTQQTLSHEGIVFQIGVVPRRIDILTSIDGVIFGTAYARKQNIEIEDLDVPFLSMADLIQNKESTGREKDRIDAGYLRAVAK